MLRTRKLCVGTLAIMVGFGLHFSGPPGIIDAYGQYGHEAGFGSSAGLRGGGGIDSSAADGVRPSMGKLLQLANKLIKEEKFQEALVRVQQADEETRARMTDKIPIGRSSYEEYALQKTRAFAAVGAGNLPLAARSYEAVIATGRLPARDRVKLIEYLAGLYYQAKDYGNTRRWAQRYFDDGGTSRNVRTLVSSSYYLEGDFASTRSEVSAQIADDEKSGQTPTKEQLSMLADSCLKLNDHDGYAQALEKLAALYPQK